MPLPPQAFQSLSLANIFARSIIKQQCLDHTFETIIVVIFAGGPFCSSMRLQQHGLPYSGCLWWGPPQAACHHDADREVPVAHALPDCHAWHRSWDSHAYCASVIGKLPAFVKLDTISAHSLPCCMGTVMVYFSSVKGFAGDGAGHLPAVAAVHEGPFHTFIILYLRCM